MCGGPFSQVHLILTGRTNTWEHATIALERFKVYGVRSLSYPTQVNEFINKWFQQESWNFEPGRGENQAGILARPEPLAGTHDPKIAEHKDRIESTDARFQQHHISKAILPKPRQLRKLSTLPIPTCANALPPRHDASSPCAERRSRSASST
jgi:hypothetical protein